MDYNRIKTWLAIIGVISLIALSFFIGRKSVQPTITTEIRWDTLTIEKPVPYKVEKVRTEYVYVPTPADTVVTERVDSVLVAVDVERRVYQDSSYRAVVSGAVVGDIHPTLDHIDIYSRSETRIIEHKAPMFRPYIRGSIGKELMGIGGGVSVKDRVDIDVQYMRMGNKNMVVVGANYRFNVKTK
jgi:hypothetical protein